MPRPRITVRWLMVAVAAVAVSLGVVIERRARFGRLERYHREQAGTLVFRPDAPAGNNPSIIGPDGRRLSRDRHKWHRELSGKYERAALRPWLLVGFDPPRPE